MTTSHDSRQPRHPDHRDPVPVQHSGFRHVAERCALALGSAWAFIAALAVCVVWAIAGPFTGYSDTWQLTINTGTTLVTFLAVFLIQNTQNRDALAIHLKLDELLRAVSTARTALVNLEELSDEELTQLRREFARLSATAKRTGGGASGSG